MNGARLLWAAALSLVCLRACAPSPPVLKQVDIDAVEKDVVDGRAAALREVRTSPTNASGEFYVGWEMHYGYTLTPVDHPDEELWPDFADERIQAAFDDFIQPGRTYLKGEAMPLLGKKIMCRCTGVEWTYLNIEKRFLVRSAKLQAR